MRTTIKELVNQVNTQIARMNLQAEGSTMFTWDYNDDPMQKSFKLMRTGYHTVFLIVGSSHRDVLEKALVCLQASERYHDAIMSSKH